MDKASDSDFMFLSPKWTVEVGIFKNRNGGKPEDLSDLVRVDVNKFKYQMN